MVTSCFLLLNIQSGTVKLDRLHGHVVLFAVEHSESDHLRSLRVAAFNVDSTSSIASTHVVTARDRVCFHCRERDNPVRDRIRIFPAQHSTYWAIWRFMSDLLLSHKKTRAAASRKWATVASHILKRLSEEIGMKCRHQTVNYFKPNICGDETGWVTSK